MKRPFSAFRDIVLQIEPITEPLIDGYHQVLGVVARERKYLQFLDAPSLANSYDFVMNNIRVGNPHFVAVNDDQVIGWCDICRDTEISSLHVGSFGMGVHPDFRGQGIGLRLARAALADARAKDFERIELTVYAGNEPAIRLYEKLGFAHEGVMRRAALVDGEYRDIVMMGLVRE